MIAIPRDLGYKDARAAAEREIDKLFVKPLMEEHGGNQSQVAELLGIDRGTLRDRINNLSKEQA